MTDSGKKPTLADVAAIAGVSMMTAGRALNSNPLSVAPSTRQRIEKAAEKLGYIPNLAASSLSGRRSGLVGVLVSTLSTPTFSVTLDIIRSELQRHEYQLVVGDTDYSSSNEAALLRTLLGRQVDGIILASALRTPSTRELLVKSGVPAVGIWDQPSHPVGGSVGFDNRYGGAMVADHFVEARYRNPVFVGGGEKGDWILSEERSRKRWEGFRDRYRELTGQSPALLMTPAVMDFEGGARALKDILDARPPYDAAFFVYDICAIGAVFEGLRQGLNIPEDLAICGFGGLPLCQAMYPSLSTVHIPFEEIGRHAASMAVDLMEGNIESAAPINLTCKLVRRQTS